VSGFLGVIVLAALVLLVARAAFERRIARETDALLAAARPAGARTVTEADLRRMPEPVRRWLRYSRVVGAAVPATVRLRQDGEFRLEGRSWMPYAAEQYFTVDPPGYLWKAKFRMAPLVTIAGRDRYRSGTAGIEMRLLSLVPVAREQGGGLDQGGLLRFLGELQWFPAAALAPYVGWEELGPDSARATMTFGGVTASMTFRFGPDGRLLESSAMRYNDARKRNERWVNRNRADGELGGMRVPTSGEALWEYDAGPSPYIRWRVTTIELNRPARFQR
jgi:hypothetical protein